MSKNVLVVGGGGREHALAWKLSQSPKVGKLYVAPGNGGTAQIAENIEISVVDIDGIARFADKTEIDLTVVGPDDPLALGIVDAFHAKRMNGRLETSGGRVLSVTATGNTLRETLDRAYAAARLIYFRGMHYRKDIGVKTLALAKKTP